MSKQFGDLPPWRPVLYDGHSVGLAEGAAELFRLVIEPACRAIASELEQYPRGEDDETIQRWNALRDVQLELHRSFALTLGALWERHFRRHLAYSASVIPTLTPKQLVHVERGSWKETSAAFMAVRKFPLTRFPSHDQLAILYEVTSAVRHGNGRATAGLYASHPHLFSHNPIRSWFSHSTFGGEPDHSIHKLEITFEQLVDFKTAIVEFWQMIRALQASSQSEDSAK